MLRSLRNSALLFAAVSGASFMTGCSSEDGIASEENVSEPLINTDSYTVFSGDQSRVHNYGNSSTRAGEYKGAATSFDMPECPTIPEGAKDLNYKNEWDVKVNLNNGTPEEGEYYIKAGETLDSGLKLNGNVTIYVAGTLSLSYLNVTGSNTIYILEGGALSLPGSLNPGLTVYNYGDLKAPDGVTIAGDVYSAVDITECKTIGVNNGAKLFSKGTIDADEVRLNGEAIACAFIAESIVINSDGTIKTSYFEADKMTLNKGNVVLDNNGLVKADQLFISNQNTRFTVNGTNAVVAANKFYTNDVEWPKDIFAKEFALDFGECKLGNEYSSTDANFNDFGFQVSSEDQVIYVPSAGCHGEYGTKPADPTVTELVKVTEIDPLTVSTGDHDHGVISATCVNFYGNKAYASYHLRDEGQKGCIEVFSDEGINGLSLGSYMVAEDYDFNHLIVDNGNIVTVGNHAKKGAFIGSLPVSFAESVGVSDNFTVKELTTDDVIYEDSKVEGKGEIRAGYQNAGDGNCVVRQGDYYYVATYRGYGAIKAGDFSKVLDSFKKTGGSCKHISINGGKAAVLYLDTNDTISSTASVKMFNADDINKDIASFNAVGTVAPVDGKNVVAVDGENIYACLSTGGLVRVNDGKIFQRGNVPVNGIAFDDNYIYVANGSFVSVLKKSDLSEVCYYHASSGKSANYIAVNNGKIYVAFGEDGIQVYKVEEKTITED